MNKKEIDDYLTCSAHNMCVELCGDSYLSHQLEAAERRVRGIFETGEEQDRRHGEISKPLADPMEATGSYTHASLLELERSHRELIILLARIASIAKINMGVLPQVSELEAAITRAMKVKP